MRCKKVCLLGGSGFVGRYLLAKLVRKSVDVTLLTRRRDSCRDILQPTVNVVEVPDFSSETLQRWFAGCDTVINLIGILNERPRQGRSFAAVHVELARNIAAAAVQSGVSRVLQMSALNADAEAGVSAYLRSKGAAEVHLNAIAAEGVSVVHFKPSVIFGAGDSLFNRFAGLLRIAPVLPLACPDTRFAPVYVGDVADAFSNHLDTENKKPSHVELCGPDILTLSEIVSFTAKTLDLNRMLIGLPDLAARLQGRVMNLLPGQPFTYDNYLSLQVDSVCQAGCAAQPTPIWNIVPGYLLEGGKQAHLQHLRERAGRD
ncbi:MAG: complex I NDUFA9 subunit family protein [Pseudomonadota bacterium]